MKISVDKIISEGKKKAQNKNGPSLAELFLSGPALKYMSKRLNIPLDELGRRVINSITEKNLMEPNKYMNSVNEIIRYMESKNINPEIKQVINDIVRNNSNIAEYSLGQVKSDKGAMKKSYENLKNMNLPEGKLSPFEDIEAVNRMKDIRFKPVKNLEGASGHYIPHEKSVKFSALEGEPLWGYEGIYMSPDIDDILNVIKHEALGHGIQDEYMSNASKLYDYYMSQNYNPELMDKVSGGQMDIKEAERQAYKKNPLEFHAREAENIKMMNQLESSTAKQAVNDLLNSGKFNYTSSTYKWPVKSQTNFPDIAGNISKTAMGLGKSFMPALMLTGMALEGIRGITEPPKNTSDAVMRAINFFGGGAPEAITKEHGATPIRESVEGGDIPMALYHAANIPTFGIPDLLVNQIFPGIGKAIGVDPESVRRRKRSAIQSFKNTANIPNQAVKLTGDQMQQKREQEKMERFKRMMGY